MQLSLSLSLTGRLLSSFSPSRIFALSEPGVWYDPSDLTTLFQDTAGTTPVTTPGQTVARMLDKSRGLTLGSEIVTNGTFDSNVTGWSSQANTTISWLTGELRGVSTTGSNTFVFQDLTTVSGVTYRYNATVRAQAGNILVTAYNGAFTTLLESVTVTGPTTSQTVSLVFTATGTTTRLGIGPSVATTFFIDNISVRELPGFHATQSTAASRPTYGIVPSGGRRNLLTRTEEFDNAVWVVSTGGVGTVTKSTTNAGTAPDGTTTADRVIFSLNGGTTATDLALLRQAATAPAGSATHSVYLRSFDGVSSYVMQITGADGNASNITVTPDWQRFSISATSPGTPINFGIRLRGGQTPANSNAADILIWGAQLETGSTATAYQRVGSAFDVTEAGVASLSYLSFDGVDDFLVTPTITPGVDKVQVFAGVRKLSDAAIGMVIESSTSSFSNAGTLSIRAPQGVAGNDYGFTSTGSFTGPTAAQSGGTYASPVTNVLTGIGDISADTSILRINGVQGATSAFDQGTGNYLAYPLYIGRRAGTSLPFNGNIFSLIVRFGANLDASTITNTERWVGGKTGVTI